MLKKLDKYLLKDFLGLFLVTLFMCIFVLLMQFVWIHVKDLVGKGVEIQVLAEFFVYAVASVMPLALPLAILLASIICFGNLGEKSELTAMKAAGVSLFRIMRPLYISVIAISIGAFMFSNYVLPASQVKLWALIFSLRQKNPELDIPVGQFYDGIPGYNLYVQDKNVRSGMMYGMMIYDFSKGFKDASVIMADSGKIYFTEDKQYLLLKLYSGESFENLEQKQQKATRTTQSIPYRRETFAEQQLLIAFNTDMARFDDDVLKSQHIAKNVNELITSIDSTMVILQQQKVGQASAMTATHYLGRERSAERKAIPLAEDETPEQYDIEVLYRTLSLSRREHAINTAVTKARAQKDLVDYNAIVQDEQQRYIRKHEIELHRKFTLSLACLVFFFIGAPLGAITKKGGLGFPVVMAVIMFIIYYVVDNIGWHNARAGILPTWLGMWLSTFAMLPVGAFLTYKATTDSQLFSSDVWERVLNHFKRRVAWYTKNIFRMRNKWIQLKKHYKPLREATLSS